MAIEKDDDGFLMNPDDWSEELAETIAKEFSMPEEAELTEEQWSLVPVSYTHLTLPTTPYV